MTNPPPVAPVEGHYALLRNGEAVGPINKYAKQPYLFTARLPHMSWRADGVSDWDDSDYDIIATISPADMQAVASGELERLRAALKAHEVQWNRLQDAISGMEKTMEAHGIDHFKWQPMTFDETLKGDAP